MSRVTWALKWLNLHRDGKVFDSSKFTLQLQQPQKMTLTTKVVNSDSKIAAANKILGGNSQNLLGKFVRFFVTLMCF
jgi:hypothetical protein